MPEIITTTELFVDVQGIAIVRLAICRGMNIDTGFLPFNQYLINLADNQLKYPSSPEYIKHPFSL